MDNHLGLLEHLIFSDPKSGSGDGDGEIIDFDAVEILDGNFDLAWGAEGVKFSDDLVLEATEREISFGQEVPRTARGIEEFEIGEFELKAFQLFSTDIFAFASDGGELVGEVVEEERVDDFMNVGDGSIMHAALTTSDGVECGFKECAEDGGTYARPIKLRVIGGIEQEVMRDFAIDLGDIGLLAEEIAVDVRELFQLRAEIRIATVDWDIENFEQIDQSGSTVVSVSDIIGELIVIEDEGVFGVEAEHKANAKFIERGGVDGFIGTLESLIEIADDLTGLLRDFDFGVNVFVFGVDEEIEATELLSETLDGDDIGLDVVATIHVVNSDLVEIGGNDPTGLAGIGELIGVTFSLLERREEHAVGLFGGLIEVDAARLLLDECLGEIDISVDETGMPVDINGELE